MIEPRQLVSNLGRSLDQILKISTQPFKLVEDSTKKPFKTRLPFDSRRVGGLEDESRRSLWS